LFKTIKKSRKVLNSHLDKNIEFLIKAAFKVTKHKIAIRIIKNIFTDILTMSFH